MGSTVSSRFWEFSPKTKGKDYFQYYCIIIPISGEGTVDLTTNITDTNVFVSSKSTQKGKKQNELNPQ